LTIINVAIDLEMAEYLLISIINLELIKGMEVLIFQQFGSAEKKIEGIKRYGKGITLRLISVDVHLPELVDNPEGLVDDDFRADLVLNYFKHPDLSDYLIRLCDQKGITVISAGKKGAGVTPFTCCGLGANEKFGEYGLQFGMPEYRLELVDGAISKIEVVRGAPCGATWDSLGELRGMSIEEALVTLPRRVQYFCVADPSGFDPVTGKSPVHYAGHVHIAALKKALSELQE